MTVYSHVMVFEVCVCVCVGGGGWVINLYTHKFLLPFQIPMSVFAPSLPSVPTPMHVSNKVFSTQVLH